MTGAVHDPRGVPATTSGQRPRPTPPPPVGVGRIVALGTLTPALVRTAIVLGVHLLVVGHDLPGGGFIGALVLGSGVALAVLADERLPAVLRAPGRLLGIGLLIVTAVGILPAVVGRTPLDMTWVTLDLGPVGSFKLTSALVFDIGVAVLVVGLVVAVMRALGPRRAS